LGSADYVLKLWDAATGQVFRTFEAHVGAVNLVALSFDGTRLSEETGSSQTKRQRCADTSTLLDMSPGGD
jgi:WD40 repeat protein